MKTTVELPEQLLKEIKALGAVHRFSFRQFVTQAVLDRLARMKREESSKPWMKAFGMLKHLHKENVRIEQEIEEEFGRVDPKEWR